MARAAGRATQRDIDDIHRMAAKAIKAEFRYFSKKKERVPAALLGNALKMLQLTGSTDAARGKTKVDRLAGLLQDYHANEGKDEAATDFTQPPARDFREED
jgi:hypothetical protein